MDTKKQKGIKEQEHKSVRRKNTMLNRQTKILAFGLKIKTAVRYLFSLIETATTYTCMFNTDQSMVRWTLYLCCHILC